MNRRNFIRNGLIGAAGVAAIGGGGIFYYINRPEFGRLPSGERLKKILASPRPIYLVDELNGKRVIYRHKIFTERDVLK